MNINENRAIDQAENEAQELWIKKALISEAVEHSDNFLHYLLGWMQDRHLDEISEAAQSWLNTHKE